MSSQAFLSDSPAEKQRPPVSPSAESADDAATPTPQHSAEFLPAADDPEILRVLAVGSRTVVNVFVHRLHQQNIAHYSEWSRLLPTPNPGEFMRILTKRISIDRPPSDRTPTA